MSEPVTPETLTEYRARIGRQLDDHFSRFADAIAAINAGFAATGNADAVDQRSP